MLTPDEDTHRRELAGRFIAIHGGMHLFNDVPLRRQAQMLDEVIRILNEGSPHEIERAKHTLSNEPFETIVKFFCDDAFLNREMGENGERFDATARAAHREQRLKDAKVWFEDSFAATKDYLRHRLLLEPTMLTAAWVAGVSHEAAEYTSASVALASAMALVVDRYEARLYPHALKRLHQQNDPDLLPRIESLRQAPHTDGMVPDDPVGLRRRQGLLSRDVMTYVLDTSRPSVRKALLSVPEKTFLQFGEAIVRRGHGRRPPIDFERPLNRIDRAFVRTHSVIVAHQMGLPGVTVPPSKEARAIDAAEVMVQGKEAVIDVLASMPALLTRGQLGQRLDQQKPATIEPGAARLGRRARAS